MILANKKYLNIIAITLFYLINIVWVRYFSSPAIFFVVTSVFFSTSLLFLSYNGKRINYSKAYIAFIITLWLFSPFIRRYGDLQNGWSDLNVYGLAPILSTLICIFFLNKKLFLLKSLNKSLLMIFTALFYSLIIGVLNTGIVAALYSFLTWISPVIIFTYILSYFQSIDRLAPTIIKTIVISGLILALYGLFQYYYLPDWDRYWLLNVPMTSVGKPFPMSFRVFSLSNSPMVFGPILAMFIIIGIAKRNIIAIGFVIVAIFALFLTLVRAAWFGLAIGLIFYTIWLYKNNFIVAMRFIFISLFCGSVMFIYLGQTDAWLVISNRIESIYSLEQDVSFNARMEFYADMALYAVTNVLGDGMGSVGVSQRLAQGSNAETTFDNGFLEVLVTLGWLGTILYLIPLFSFLKKVTNCFITTKNNFLASYSVISISVFIQMIFSNRLIGPIGFFFFLFMSLSLAYYYNIHHLKENKND